MPKQFYLNLKLVNTVIFYRKIRVNPHKQDERQKVRTEYFFKLFAPNFRGAL
jgi:hypothetical protein